MDPETGYMHFAKNFFHIQHSKHGRLLFAHYEYQEGLLNSYHNNRFNVNMLPRQSGKCLTNQALIEIRNKITGEEIEISIGEFYEMQSKK